MNTKYATAKITESDSANSASSLKIREILNTDNYFILEELKVNDPKDFGKGYGKEILINILKKYKRIALIPSFLDFNNCEECYCGRELMTMESMETAPKKLMNEFYLKIVKEQNLRYEIIKNILFVY